MTVIGNLAAKVTGKKVDTYQGSPSHNPNSVIVSPDMEAVVHTIPFRHSTHTVHHSDNSHEVHQQIGSHVVASGHVTHTEAKKTVPDVCLRTLVQQQQDWKDVTPSNRYGEENTRQCNHSEQVHCLIVTHDEVKNTDVVHLEFMYLDDFPAVNQKHELYSVCISKDVRIVLWHRDHENPFHVTKVLYLNDYTQWTQPQVEAIALMMHASIRTGGLAHVRNDDCVKNAEIFAEHYCKNAGVARSELHTIHTSNVPFRITRQMTESVNKSPAVYTHHGIGAIIEPHHTDHVIDTSKRVRRNSQIPTMMTLSPQAVFGGVEQTVVSTPSGKQKALADNLDITDIYTEEDNIEMHRALHKEQRRVAKEQRKAEKQYKREQKRAHKEGLKAHKAAVKQGRHVAINISAQANEVHQDAHAVPVNTTSAIPQEYWTSNGMKQSPMQHAH